MVRLSIKVVERYSQDDFDYRESYEIKVTEDGKVVYALEFYDGEPEDNYLCRNFYDVYSIVDLMKYAYEAGKQGKEIEFIDEREDE